MSYVKVQVVENEGEEYACKEYAHKSIVAALTNRCEQLEARVKKLEEALEVAEDLMTDKAYGFYSAKTNKGGES